MSIMVCENKGLRHLLAAVMTAAVATAFGARVEVPANVFREGGWKLDVQFMDEMGSPYLLAHGMGSPVPDATATVEIPEAGDWRVWVRSRKWVEGAGAFQVLFGGTPLAKTFGRGGDAWAWEDGGTVTLPAGRTRLQLRDLDGFDGRCAGIVLTKGEDAPKGAITVTDRAPDETREFELVVVGGGIPGCCAAVAAARAGAKVALVQDRPVLGGNASGEVRVWSGGEVRYPLVAELRGQFRNMGYENAFSDADRQAKLEREPNLTLFLSHRAFGVEKEGERIAAVKALDLAANRVVRFRAPYFCDTTGDGWVGFWAGADYRYGREGRDETGEKYAPAKGDCQTLGSSIMWESSDATIDSPFSAPWAEPYACGKSCVAGDWNWEFGLRQNLFTEGEAVRDRVLLAIYGAFSNAKKESKNAFRRLTTCPFILGKRESRRLMGDHIFCERDVTEKTPFDDAVASGSWSIDLHYTIDEKVPFLTRCEQPHFGRYWIPYRSLYSRNVPNLFMAGRCFSCTHVGLGSPRVINTLAQLGCAVGEAAAMCLKGGYSPRELYAKGHARELQRRLGGDFPGNPDPAKAGWTYVDDETKGAVTFTGPWRFDWHCNGGQAGDHTHNSIYSEAAATYKLPVAAAGRYRLMGLVPSLFFETGDRLVELTVVSGGTTKTLVWNQYVGSGWWQEIGTLDLEPGAEMTLRRAPGCKNRIYADGFALAPVAASGVRKETLSDGWTFRLEGDREARPVRVPHDWGVERGFLKAGTCPGQGDLPFVGKGLYRRAFDGFEPPVGGRTYLTLDGVQCRSVVKLNGRTVGGRPFGYASETIDVTDALLPTGNVLEVEAENVPRSSRWYPGSGIFRDVTVRVCPRDHVKPDTLFVRTLEATEKSARVAVSFEWRGGVSNAVIAVESPRLWSPEHPELYELELFGEKFRYGIRTAVFDPAKGFFLNGVHRQMRGVCLHHDLGPIGAAFDRDFARRQLALLKEMGCDAIRTSHNPPASALLDLCDEMGLLVMDEAFDMWELPKGDYSNFWQEWHARDLAEFVRRDRSHPSVVMWSVGNELREFDDADSARQIRIASELVSIVRANDPTRPVTFGSWKEAPMWNGCQNTVDAFGANYLPFKYAEFLRRNPKVGLVGTETSSCVSSRGEYFFPVVASPIRGEGDLKRRRDEGREKMVRGAQMSGYDLWGPHENDYPPDVEFEHQERHPQVYGEFVWTGFDYLGEPDPCAESGGRSSYFGIFDLAGLPKDRYWLYKAQWRPEERTAHLLPHWTWPGREGEVTPVHVYSSGDEAELFLNGVSQGRKRRGQYEYRFRWDDVRYAPGELRVKTWREGREWAEDVVRTAGEPVRLERAERRFGRLTFVTFALKDANGTVSPNDDRVIALTVRPGTRLVSLCNGDAASREDFRGSSMRTFHGLVVAVVEGDPAGLSAWFASDTGSDVARHP